MLDMGFKPQVDRILRSAVTTGRRCSSGHLRRSLSPLARAYTVKASHVRAEAPAEAQRGEIDHTFVAVTAEDKLDRLVEQLRGDRGPPSCSCGRSTAPTSWPASSSASTTSRRSLCTATSRRASASALAQFEVRSRLDARRDRRRRRGLDVDDITHVINFDPPQGDNDYVHRVGRTGRAGRSGTGVTLVLPDQRGDVGRLATRLGHGKQFGDSGMSVSTRPVGRSGNNGNGGRRRKRR